MPSDSCTSCRKPLRRWQQVAFCVMCDDRYHLAEHCMLVHSRICRALKQLEPGGPPVRFAENNLAAYTPPECPRCGAPATHNWVNASELTDPVSMVMPNRHRCETPGCVDENGYNTIRPVHGGGTR